MSENLSMIRFKKREFTKVFAVVSVLLFGFASLTVQVNASGKMWSKSNIKRVNSRMKARTNNKTEAEWSKDMNEFLANLAKLNSDDGGENIKKFLRKFPFLQSWQLQYPVIFTDESIDILRSWLERDEFVSEDFTNIIEDQNVVVSVMNLLNSSMAVRSSMDYFVPCNNISAKVMAVRMIMRYFDFPYTCTLGELMKMLNLPEIYNIMGVLRPRNDAELEYILRGVISEKSRPMSNSEDFDFFDVGAVINPFSPDSTSNFDFKVIYNAEKFPPNKEWRFLFETSKNLLLLYEWMYFKSDKEGIIEVDEIDAPNAYLAIVIAKMIRSQNSKVTLFESQLNDSQKIQILCNLTQLFKININHEELISLYDKVLNSTCFEILADAKELLIKSNPDKKIIEINSSLGSSVIPYIYRDSSSMVTSYINASSEKARILFFKDLKEKITDRQLKSWVQISPRGLLNLLTRRFGKVFAKIIFCTMKKIKYPQNFYVDSFLTNFLMYFKDLAKGSELFFKPIDAIPVEFQEKIQAPRENSNALDLITYFLKSPEFYIASLKKSNGELSSIERMNIYNMLGIKNCVDVIDSSSWSYNLIDSLSDLVAFVSPVLIHRYKPEVILDIIDLLQEFKTYDKVNFIKIVNKSLKYIENDFPVEGQLPEPTEIAATVATLAGYQNELWSKDDITFNLNMNKDSDLITKIRKAKQSVSKNFLACDKFCTKICIWKQYIQNCKLWCAKVVV